MKQNLKILLIAFCSIIFINIKTVAQNKGKLYQYFNTQNKDIKKAEAVSNLPVAPISPLTEEEAMKDIKSFYENIKPTNPKTKCFVEVNNLQALLEGLKELGATGIRIYSAAYTATTASRGREEGMPVLEKDYHLIIVPIKENGEEIKKDKAGNWTIYNYNNDCPFSCPRDMRIATLLDASSLGFCR